MYGLHVYLVANLISTMKFKPHSIKGSKAITSLNGVLPLHHIGPSHWQMSKVWYISIMSL
jgi:hypothetical protein